MATHHHDSDHNRSTTAHHGHRSDNADDARIVDAMRQGTADYQDALREALGVPASAPATASTSTPATASTSTPTRATVVPAGARPPKYERRNICSPAHGSGVTGDVGSAHREWHDLAPDDAHAMMRLADLTQGYLVEMLAEENTLSNEHRAALTGLSATMSEMALGFRTGRYALGAPTGFGKTSAIVALVRGLHELGLLDRVGILVCQARIESLCELKRRLCGEVLATGEMTGGCGVPVDDVVGLKHSCQHNHNWRETGLRDGEASEPSTREGDLGSRAVLLV